MVRVVAIVFLAIWGSRMLPGMDLYTTKPEVDWSRPGAYLAYASVIAAVWLAVEVIV